MSTDKLDRLLVMSYTEALIDAAQDDQFDADWYLLEADEDEVVIPASVQQAAQAICTEYEGFVLTSINQDLDTTYLAWYNDTTLDPEDDGYIMCREFTCAGVDTTFGTTVRKTYIAAKKEIMIEHITADGTVVGTGWVGVHYQSPLYDLTSDAAL